jgi:hypothetical protein
MNIAVSSSNVMWRNAKAISHDGPLGIQSQRELAQGECSLCPRSARIARLDRNAGLLLQCSIDVDACFAFDDGPSYVHLC